MTKLITIIAALLLTTPAFAFEIAGSHSIYDQAEVKRIIIEADSVTIEFQEGFNKTTKDEADKDVTTFVPVGTDHIVLSGAAKSSFIKTLDEATDKLKAAETPVKAARPVAVAEEPVVEEPK
jgi:hypothetical protein